MQTYINKSKSGHYTLTISEGSKKLRFKLLTDIHTARKLIPHAVNQFNKPRMEVDCLGFNVSFN